MKFVQRNLPLRPMATGIGSLPHHNIDAALAFAFQTSLPFLPQIPLCNPWEYMIAQALEGLPGLKVEKDGLVLLDLDYWTSRSFALNEKLEKAFSETAKHEAFEGFEPSTANSSGWQPFVWELEERGSRLAKVQLAGPLTSQWVLKLQDGTNLSRYPEVTSQIYRLVLARALAMSRRLQKAGVQPLLYLDEPGLYAYSAAEPRHVLALQELKLLIQTLRKEGVLVGLHCCSDTDWKAVLGLGLDVLSLDTGLSLSSILEHDADLENFIQRGGRLSLGIVPTSRISGQELQSLEARDLFLNLLETFDLKLKDRPQLVRKILTQAIYTPACGLALHSVSDAEVILDLLNQFESYCTRALFGQSESLTLH
ncbi:MAG: hypothetical protein AB1540_00190 [Bdellovibrionota bacterium]